MQLSSVFRKVSWTIKRIVQCNICESWRITLRLTTKSKESCHVSQYVSPSGSQGSDNLLHMNSLSLFYFTVCTECSTPSPPWAYFQLFNLCGKICREFLFNLSIFRLSYIPQQHKYYVIYKHYFLNQLCALFYQLIFSPL